MSTLGWLDLTPAMKQRRFCDNQDFQQHESLRLIGESLCASCEIDGTVEEFYDDNGGLQPVSRQLPGSV